MNFQCENFIDQEDSGNDSEEETTKIIESTLVDIDNDDNSDFVHNLVGCKIKIFYGDLGEWFVGNVTWFNKALQKLRIHFEEDDSDDYLCEDDINGMDILLLT